MTAPTDDAAADAVKVTVHVRADPGETFRIFTEEIDQWWQRGPRYRIAGSRRGILHLEPKPGGRLFESFETEAGEAQVVVTGRITVWEPPSRLALVWRNVNFHPDEETLVEISFEETRAGTRVVLRHSGWAALRPDHPARHGLGVGDPFVRMIGTWWADLLRELRHHARSAEGSPPIR